MLKSKFSLSRHFEYANEQITYHFWLCTYQNILFGTVGMPSNYLYNTVDIDEAFHMAFSISRQTTMLVHLVQTQ
jgi:hypothetical protein